MSELISAKELCEKYHVVRSTLMRWRKRGMPYTQFSTKVIIYNRKEVETWINENVK